MHNAELLHRFFDEGLKDSSEDILFESMASDTALRRQFMEHLKIHSYIREDLAAITTPASVSSSLMLGLGLADKTAIVESSGNTLLKTASIAGAALLRFAGTYRKHILTAAISAGMTAGLFLLLDEPTLTPAIRESPTPMLEQPTASPESKTSPESVDPSRSEPGEKLGDNAAEVAPTTSSNVAASANSVTSGKVVTLGNAVIVAAVEASAKTMMAADNTFAQNRTENRSTAEWQLPFIAAVDIPQAADIPELRSPGDESSIETASIETFPEDATVLKPESAHLFRRTPQTTVFSNMVFELRKLMGKSWPEVDLPHSSFTVFENMALSAVYKVTDNHAFGFEYGRENFGQEYSSFDMARSNELASDIEIAYDPPVPWMAGEYRENKMLDMFGAVWKMSLPEYGMFGFFYPYTRTFLGATKQGPLAKLRVGVEMFPSNISMLNVGIEYGLLRYQIEQISYYTTKLNFTFGVALGF